MCCPGPRMCMFCTCLIMVVILIGMIWGFGVFKDGFHKLKGTMHYTDLNANLSATPFFGFPVPPPPF